MTATRVRPISKGLLKAPDKDATLRALRGFSINRSEDRVEGKFGKSRTGHLSTLATAHISGRMQGRSKTRGKSAAAPASDSRQRVIVKLHYHAHTGGGGKLPAHGRYLERDGAGAGGEPGRFYDLYGDADDAAERLSAWQVNDRRHIRIILAPESGARFADLKDMTRATMNRVERDLGVSMEWIAVDHFNTDNPHSHIILRGRRGDGPDLVISRDYAAYGLRHAARDVASEMLGARGREDERLALSREVHARGFTRLDEILDKRFDLTLPVRLHAIGANFNPELASALRGRMRSLARMGLANESVRDCIKVEPDWKERLHRVERQIDIKRLLSTPLTPGLPKTRLYARALGPLSGEVMTWGTRSDGGAKAFVVVRPENGGPVLINTTAKAIRGIEEGDLAIVRAGSSARSRVSLSIWKPKSLRRQSTEPAFNSLDEELQRRARGLPPAFPSHSLIDHALRDRGAWLERHGMATKDAHGALSLSEDLTSSLRALEIREAENTLSRATAKPILTINDGLEREWRVRAIGSMNQGRYAALERPDGVAIIRIPSHASLSIGKDYAIKSTAKTLKITPSIGLER